MRSGQSRCWARSISCGGEYQREEPTGHAVIEVVDERRLLTLEKCASRSVVRQRTANVNFYERRILPQLIHLAMRQSSFSPYRQRVVAGAHGRVLEIGVGSGLDLPFSDRRRQSDRSRSFLQAASEGRPGEDNSPAFCRAHQRIGRGDSARRQQCGYSCDGPSARFLTLRGHSTRFGEYSRPTVVCCLLSMAVRRIPALPRGRIG